MHRFKEEIIMKKRIVRSIAALTLAISVFSAGATAANACTDNTRYVGIDYCTDSYTVFGTKYYLALRTEMAYRDENEIGRIVNGQTVDVVDKCTGNPEYWYVYAPTLGKYGYVNCNYLKAENGYGIYVVSGVVNYLALRTETAYRDENETGQLCNGEMVNVLETNTGNPEYWYVYVLSSGKYGYVNKNYLV